MIARFVDSFIHSHFPFIIAFEGRNWSDKSQAAIRRENEAKHMFDSFLSKVDQETSSFPYSKELIPPDVHLTQACYTSFRAYVTSKGCKCVRREASLEEKNQLPKSNRRNGKMYFIKITVPTSPAKLLEVKAEHERKAQEAKVKKQANEEKKRKQEQELTEKTKQEHLDALAFVKNGASSNGTTATAAADTALDKENLVNKKEEGSPSKRLKTASSAPLVITVPQDRILAHHENMLSIAKSKIRRQIAQRKEDELAKLRAELAQKYHKLEDQEIEETQAQYDQVKKVIVDATTTNKAPPAAATTAVATAAVAAK